MKKYIGTKQLKAKPMNLGEYNKYRGWKQPENEDPNTEGYLVEYQDGGKPNDERHEGYISWSPKDVFEKAYKVADTFLDRLYIEREGLADKFEKYLTFVDSPKFREVIKGNYPAFLLHLQRDSMGSYLNCLNNRIEFENGCKKECNTHFEFGEAVKALKFGLAIRRSGWNGKGLFVVKQIPAHITEEIIPKMQSLPQSAKDIIMSRENKVIDYTSQMLIINPEGRADSWVPSVSDVFAEDWEIVE